MFEGFQLDHLDVGGTRLRVRWGGAGPAVLLVHGHPRTHTTWHRVAPALVAAGYTVVCPDLRGYGQSRGPADRPDHAQASKRAMAGDLVAVMRVLGHDRFIAVGHDRGGYVVQRLALDHPGAVSRVVILGDVPIGEALTRCDARFAQAWWHWFFMGQPAPLAERLIAADLEAWYHFDRVLMGEENYADVWAAVSSPSVRHAMCEDYRAGLGPDRAADDADRAAGRRIVSPLLVLWGSDDDLAELYDDDVLGSGLPGRRRAVRLRSAQRPPHDRGNAGGTHQGAARFLPGVMAGLRCPAADVLACGGPAPAPIRAVARGCAGPVFGRGW
jgi:haloacetate dehalogenase